MINNLDVKAIKYKFLSLLKETELLINENRIKTSPPIQSLFPRVDYYKEFSTEEIQRVNKDLPSLIDEIDSVITPTNEKVNVYINKVAEYITLLYDEKLIQTIYSPFVFDNWLDTVSRTESTQTDHSPIFYANIIIDSLRDNESVPAYNELSPHFIKILKHSKNNFEDDIKTMLSFYKEGKIKRNTYAANIFDAIIGLFAFMFLDGKAKIAPYYGLFGYILLDNGLKQDALVFFQKSIEMEKDYYTGYVGLADTYRYMDEHEKAIKQYSKAISIVDKYKQSEETPHFLDTYNTETSYYTDCFYSLSLCYANLNQFEKSISYIERAIEEKDTSHIGHKIDKFESLASAKEYILNLYSKYEKNDNIDESDFSKLGSDPRIHETFIALYNRENKNWETLSTKSLKILKNINFMENCYNIIEPDDYSPLTLQYFKIIEIELYDKILKKIEVWLLNKSTLTLNLRSDIYSNNKFKKVTLASYLYVFSESDVKDFLKEIYPNYYNFLSGSLLSIIDKLLKVRNGTAHRSLTTKQKHEEIKKIIIDNKIFDKFCEL